MNPTSERTILWEPTIRLLNELDKDDDGIFYCGGQNPRTWLLKLARES